jgi:hypothetical protein
LAKTNFGRDADYGVGVSGEMILTERRFPVAGLPACGTSMNRAKGNVTFKIPARMRGNSRIGGQPDGKGVIMDQLCDTGQHIREQKHHSNRVLCCPVPEAQYVSGVRQGHNHGIYMNRQTL